MSLMEKIFGDLNAKELKKISKIVDKVEELDESMQALSDDELRGKTEEFKKGFIDDIKCVFYTIRLLLDSVQVHRQ